MIVSIYAIYVSIYGMASSNDQPRITLEPKQKSKHINSIEMWVTQPTKSSVEASFLIKYSEIIRDLAARGYNFRRERSKSQTKRPKAYSWGAVH